MTVPSHDERPACAHVSTEAQHPDTQQLDLLALGDPAAAVDMMLRADHEITAAIAEARNEIATAVECVADCLSMGGRLLYIGAGTSGRLGVLDAVECPPTFQCDPSQVQGVLAGGRNAMFLSVEGAEDDRSAGARDLEALDVSKCDFVLGISASASAPYVHGAIAYANRVGARTALLACVPREEFGDDAQLPLRIVTGPETLAGSTRLRAGTATKMVLNMISTLAMARLGKVHGNLMVDVNTAGNAKLFARGCNLVSRLAPCDGERAKALLQDAQGSVKVAILMGAEGLKRSAAEARLAEAKGVLREALSPRQDP
ncbi:MAG: N-acetylmuramic acid 6-phosphate etherase [Planctomycetota bacterium]|jgi:N-acetylmuramic acid 6-phosphate etherase|nr:N-acetylmuramic acid 6-phosphate etherase [Planctomycetota bacterium]